VDGGLELDSAWHRAADLLHSYRRSAAALLAGIAVICALTALHPKPTPTVAVWAAARDLGGGQPLTRADLRVERLPARDVPAGAFRAVDRLIGRLLAAPVRRGEPLTDVRMLAPALLAADGVPSDVAVPVRVTDGGAALALVQSGDEIAVIATDDSVDGAPADAAPVVQDVRVLAVADHPSVDGAGLVIVAASPGEADDLAQIPAGDRVSIALHRQS
jgi:Flp pilus assembly protein CpaB